MLKRFSFFIFICFVFFSSCNQSIGNDGTKFLISPLEHHDNLLGVDSDLYESMLDLTIMDGGNNYRLKSFLRKLKEGEHVYICCLGGSITEGQGPAIKTDGYAYQFATLLKNNFDSSKIHFQVAGIGGTPSTLGILRYDSDVVEALGNVPDLLILEFSVNDKNESIYLRSYENLIWKALSESKKTAVISLFSAAKRLTVQNEHKRISDYYGIPSISILDVYNFAVAKGYFSDIDFLADNVHPTTIGHAFMADSLYNFLVNTDRQEFSSYKKIPSTMLFEDSFSNFKRIKDNDFYVEIKKGSFCDVDKNTKNFCSELNWYRKSDSNNESFVVNVFCKGFLFSYKHQSVLHEEDFGKVAVLVDGSLYNIYDGSKASVNGWSDNNFVDILIDENTSKWHKIEIKMVEGYEDKGFTIAALGYFR